MDIKMVINYFKLKNYIKSLGFDDFQARESIKKIRAMDKKLKHSFYLWFKKGIKPDVMVGEYTFDELTGDLKMNEIKAFLFMDWLIKEPQVAENALLHMTNPVIVSDQLKSRLAASLDETMLKDEPENTEDIIMDDGNAQ